MNLVVSEFNCKRIWLKMNLTANEFGCKGTWL